MANTKSAKKAIRQSRRKYIRNREVLDKVKTGIKEIKKMVSKGDVSGAREKMPNVYSVIDKAAKGGLFHKNNAARKKSFIARLVDKTK